MRDVFFIFFATFKTNLVRDVFLLKSLKDLGFLSHIFYCVECSTIPRSIVAIVNNQENDVVKNTEYISPGKRIAATAGKVLADFVICDDTIAKLCAT